MVENRKSIKSRVGYFIGTLDFGFLFLFGREALLEGYYDSEWERHHHKRRSRYGHLITVAGSSLVPSFRLQLLTA